MLATHAASNGPPSCRILLRILSGPGALLGFRLLITEVASVVVKAGEVCGLSTSGGRSERSMMVVGALVPVNKRSACVVGSDVKEPLERRRGVMKEGGRGALCEPCCIKEGLVIQLRQVSFPMFVLELQDGQVKGLRGLEVGFSVVG